MFTYSLLSVEGSGSQYLLKVYCCFVILYFLALNMNEKVLGISVEPNHKILIFLLFFDLLLTPKEVAVSCSNHKGVSNLQR